MPLPADLLQYWSFSVKFLTLKLNAFKLDAYSAIFDTNVPESRPMSQTCKTIPPVLAAFVWLACLSSTYDACALITVNVTAITCFQIAPLAALYCLSFE